MSKKRKILSMCGLIIFVFLIGLSMVQAVSASHHFATQSEITSTPNPVTISPTPTLFIDPDSIGDTSGVIVLGMIIVFIIIAGVIWGGLQYKQ